MNPPVPPAPEPRHNYLARKVHSTFEIPWEAKAAIGLGLCPFGVLPLTARFVFTHELAKAKRSTQTGTAGAL